MQKEQCREIADRIDEIYALAHLMSLVFDQVENMKIHINPHAVSRCCKRIAENIIRISEFFNESLFDP